MKLKEICLGLFFSFLLSTSLAHADIKVGTVLFNPPFVASSDTGFDIDLIREICKRMHENCTLVPMKYYQLFSALGEGQVDIVIAGIFISAERKHKYLFSLPYLVSNAQFLVLKDNPTSTIADLAGKTVGLIEQDKTMFYTHLLKYFNNNLQIQFFDDIDSVIAALSKSAIDAAFLPAPAADYWLRNGGDQFKFLGGHIALGSGVAIMASPNEQNLIDNINKQLKAMMEDGTYLKIYNNYFFH